jgi:hypothetical protein
MATILLCSGRDLIVDDEDLDLVDRYTWHSTPNGNKFYARTKRNGRWILLHRYLLGLSDPKARVDHVNGDGLDNRRSNLRLATASQNAANSGKRSKTSPYKGVYRNGKNWGAQITINGSNKYLGTYPSPELAAAAYNAVATHLFGEFARCNKN